MLELLLLGSPQTSCVGVWESRSLSKTNSAEQALWDRKKLRISSNGTFKLYGFDMAGKWKAEKGKLILLVDRTFGQERGTPAFAMFGNRLVISTSPGRLGSVKWSMKPQPDQVAWKRVRRPSVETLLKISEREEVDPETDYAYDELVKGGPEVGRDLIALLQGSATESQAVWIEILLASRKGPADIQALITALKDRRPRVARRAAAALSDVDSPIIVQPLIEFVSRNPKQKWTALRAFSRIRSPEVLPFLRNEVAAPMSNENLASALESLARQKDLESLPAFLSLSSHDDDAVRVAAIGGVLKTSAKEITPKMIESLESTARSGKWMPRVEAIVLLGQMKESLQTLTDLLDDNDSLVRREALNGIARFGPVKDPKILTKIRKLLWDDDLQVRNAAGRALNPKP